MADEQLKARADPEHENGKYIFKNRELLERIGHEVKDRPLFDPVADKVGIEWDQESRVLLTDTLLVL